MKLIPKCQQGLDGLEATNLTEWTPDSVAKYAQLFPFPITNFNALNDNVLFSREYDEEGVRNAAYQRLEQQAMHNLHMSGGNCLGSTLNWNTGKMPLLGAVPFRETTQNFWLPGYKLGAYQMKEKNSDTGKYELGTAPSSWNFARVYADAGYGRLTKYHKGVHYPIGTIFNIGHADSYIDTDYNVDEYGNPYPSHSYMLTGYDVDKNNNYTPIYYDYGNIGYGDHVLYSHANPTYAFIPYGYEHLTPENIMPKYLKWKKEAHKTPTPKVKGQEKVNDTYLSNIPQREYRLLNEYYGFGNAANILKRILAIGAQESRLGYDLVDANDDKTKTLGRQFKYNAPGIVKSAGKMAEAGWSSVSPAKYDTKAGYEHEIEIYNRLLNSGVLQGKSIEQIRKLVANQYNKEAKAFGDNYGKRRPTYEVFNNSSGPFQIKNAPDTMENFRDIYGKPIKKGSSDDIYPGKNKTLQAYNRFLNLMQSIKRRYPRLTDEQLIDAATISWNAPSKLNNKDFIDIYITNQILTDNYLEKVKNYQNTLYTNDRQ